MILLVAATEPELCGREGLVCGVGPVEAAAVTARALATATPDAVLHVGIGGADGLQPGALVVGTEAVYADISAAISVVSRVSPDPELAAAARAALPGAAALPIVTSASVGRAGRDRRGAVLVVEAMEGFGVLRACALAGVPAVEVRAIANRVGEEDRSRWQVPLAIEALTRVLPGLLATLRK